jgi:hypothetical protein
MVTTKGVTVRRALLNFAGTGPADLHPPQSIPAAFGFRSRPVIWRKIQKDVRFACTALAVAHAELEVRPQPRSFVIPLVEFVLPSLFPGAQIALRMRRAHRDCALFSKI